MILPGLPVDPDGSGQPNSASALVIHASEGGLSLQTFNDVHLRRRINFKVSFPRSTEFETFRVEAEIGWRDVYFWEDWKGYQYALKFVGSIKGDYLKLKRLFCGFSGTGEDSTPVDHSGDPL